MTALTNTFPQELNHLILYLYPNDHNDHWGTFAHFLMLDVLKTTSTFTLQLVKHAMKQFSNQLAFELTNDALATRNKLIYVMACNDILKNTLSENYHRLFLAELRTTWRLGHRCIKGTYDYYQAKTCFDAGVCTFKLTSTKYCEQLWFNCRTCWPDDINVGCCESCVDLCHKNHNIYAVGRGDFYCDCGHGDGRVLCLCIHKNLPGRFGIKMVW